MKKKTYKKMLNRINNEIKKRLIAETMRPIMQPVVFKTERIDFQTLCANVAICVEDEWNDEPFLAYAKKEIANKICNDALENGYFDFTVEKEPLTTDFGRIVIRGKLKVAK